MHKVRGEESIGVYLRIRPPPTSQQSRLLAASAEAPGSLGAAAAARGGGQSPAAFQYEVEEDFQKSTLHLHAPQRLVQEAQRATAGPSTAGSVNNSRGGGGGNAVVIDDVVNNTVVNFQYRFSRVFKPSATQEDVFNTVAKGCVESVLDGMNSTLFAYGQTGSGKTYSITGGTESYQDRGLIPRAMAMIYEEVARRRESGGGRHRRDSSVAEASGSNDEGGDGATTTYTITMSYLQIYNDKGQDLLNHGRDARTLEELPAVTIHEMEDDIVLKGLEQHSAPTLSDALNLLFLGDTNRLYCETPMNKTSSRSHCIFTIYLEARTGLSSVVRRSKLNLVDLAGSERVSKTGVSGTILTEAKYINLSLHFLEQVIVALSEKAKGVRDHVPYRNSFLTMVLRDSLGRNCKTVMLATAHVVASQVAETISTCQFAQRVALIQQAPQVNVETDPVLLVRKLRAEVAQLKDEVAYLRANGGGAEALAADRTLTADEKNVCRGMVEAYIQKAAVDGDWSSRLTGFDGDMARMYYCYEVLRERLVRSSSGGGGGEANTRQEPQQSQRLADSEAQVAALRRSLQLKENELQMLLTVLKKAGCAGAVGSGGVDLGAAGVRYNAVTQTWNGNSCSEDATSGRGEAEGVPGSSSPSPFRFTALPSGPGRRHSSTQDMQDDEQASEEVSLRRHIYRDAQRLIAELRRSSGAALTQTSATATPPHVEKTVEAALNRVTTLAQEGRFTEAEAAAATEYLEHKREYHRREKDSNNDDDRRESSGEGDKDGRTAVDVLMDTQLLQDRAQALEAFKSSYEAQHKVEETKQLLRPKYAACKTTAQQLNACVDAMKELKTKIQRRRAERAADGSDVVDAEEAAWLEELTSTKERYNLHAAQLRRDKEEVEGMHAYLKHAQEQLVRDFERWFSARQQQVQLALQQQERHAEYLHEQDKRTQLTDGLRTALGSARPADVASSESPNSQMRVTPPQSSSHNETSDTTNPINSFPGGASLAFSSSPLSTTLPQRAYALADHQTIGTASPPPPPPPPKANSYGGLPAAQLASTTPTLVSGECRLASLSTPSLTHTARSAVFLRDDQPRPVTVPTARPSTPPSAMQRDGGGNGVQSSAARGFTSAARDGWTASLSLSGSSSSNISPIITTTATTTAAAAARVNMALMKGSGSAPTLSPTRPFHLQPISDTAATANITAPSIATTSSDAVLAAAAAADKKPSNPYFPRFPSTGNAAADAQLAELYKAREAMRKQLQ
ncbi:hypothetical protein JKF63_07391 [Porcisia hertigi]|uniref:Kinesin motor domain-containing protein n=1 Tax=Porcisia hertigi TaxID=2761500 RepID=A0A837AYC3_9TRYP|nr:hypothetical protein JKF63_07391 [Porcisia hertigi]